MALFDLIYDFFGQHVFTGDHLEGRLADMHWFIGEYDVTISDYLCLTASIISVTIILVMCCMFVYKIVKLIGGLIR